MIYKLLIGILLSFFILITINFVMEAAIFILSDWYHYDVKITFNQFMTLKSIAPDKWRVNTEWSNIVLYDGEFIAMKHFIDVILLIMYRHNIYKENKTKNYNKKISKLINEWQKDINKYSDKNMEWVEYKINKLNLD